MKCSLELERFMIIRRVLYFENDQITEKNLFVNKIGDISFIDNKTLFKTPGEHIDTKNKTFFLPGLFDTHTHGMLNYDFSTVASVEELSLLMQAYAKTGVSYVMATLVSLEPNSLRTQLQLINAYLLQAKKSTATEARLIGVHLEGPWIAHNCKGAHAECALQNEISLEKFKEVIAVAPQVTEWKVTIAPDIKGAIEFIAAVKTLQSNVKVFIGHTNAEPHLLDQVKQLIPVSITHLGNANLETATRSDTADITKLTSHVVKWALANPTTQVELIIDGQHVSPAFVKLVHSKLPNNIILITDSLAPAGMPDGSYKLGTKEIIKSGSKITLATDNKLAGSAATFPEVIAQYLKILSELHLPQAQVLKLLYSAAITNPRKTAISHKVNLPDINNGVLIDVETGAIVLCVCHGEIVVRPNSVVNDFKPTLFNKPAAKPAETQAKAVDDMAKVFNCSLS